MLKKLIAHAEPYAFRAAQFVLVAALLYGAWHLAKPYLARFTGNPLSAPVVVFDVVKLANAQRAVASSFITPKGPQPNESAAELLTLQKRTRATIQAVAGAGTLVLVKQAVVNADLPDITDAVLRELGLPTDVPTQNATAYTLDEAPTNLGLFPNKQRPASPAVAPGEASKLVP